MSERKVAPKKGKRKGKAEGRGAGEGGKTQSAGKQWSVLPGDPRWEEAERQIRAMLWRDFRPLHSMHDDIATEALEEASPTWRDDAKFSTFAVRIARNMALAVKKELERQVTLDDEELAKRQAAQERRGIRAATGIPFTSGRRGSNLSRAALARVVILHQAIAHHVENGICAGHVLRNPERTAGVIRRMIEGECLSEQKRFERQLESVRQALVDRGELLAEEVPSAKWRATLNDLARVTKRLKVEKKRTACKLWALAKAEERLRCELEEAEERLAVARRELERKLPTLAEPLRADLEKALRELHETTCADVGDSGLTEAVATFAVHGRTLEKAGQRIPEVTKLREDATKWVELRRQSEDLQAPEELAALVDFPDDYRQRLADYIRKVTSLKDKRWLETDETSHAQLPVRGQQSSSGPGQDESTRVTVGRTEADGVRQEVSPTARRFRQKRKQAARAIASEALRLAGIPATLVNKGRAAERREEAEHWSRFEAVSDDPWTDRVLCLIRSEPETSAAAALQHLGVPASRANQERVKRILRFFGSLA